MTRFRKTSKCNAPLSFFLAVRKWLMGGLAVSVSVRGEVRSTAEEVMRSAREIRVGHWRYPFTFCRAHVRDVLLEANLNQDMTNVKKRFVANA